MMTDTKLFYLMHNNTKVLFLHIDGVGNLIKIGTSGNKQLVPLGGSKSPIELKQWWKRRAVPITQGNVAQTLRALNIPTYVRSFLEYQIMTDYLLTNTDRHYNNFGVLRDTNTLRFVGMAPIFDTGNSMFWRNPNYPLNYSLAKIEVSGFRRWEKDLLKYLSGRVTLDINRLLAPDEIMTILGNTNLHPNEINSIVIGYEKKVESLKRFIK